MQNSSRRAPSPEKEPVNTILGEEFPCVSPLSLAVGDFLPRSFLVFRPEKRRFHGRALAHSDQTRETRSSACQAQEASQIPNSNPF